VVDTEGLLLNVLVHPANVQERATIHPLMKSTCEKVPTIKKLWLDAGYTGPGAERLAQERELKVEIVHRAQDRMNGLWTKGEKPPKAKGGFQVQPRRWVVERTFGWLGRNRRLSKDYEAKPETTEAWIWVAMLRLLLRRIGRRRRRR
jgi:putative transposase